MPSKSVKQAKTMSAIAHGWRPTGKAADIPVSVAKEFHAADSGKKYGKEKPMHRAGKSRGGLAGHAPQPHPVTNPGDYDVSAHSSAHHGKGGKAVGGKPEQEPMHYDQRTYAEGATSQPVAGHEGLRNNVGLAEHHSLPGGREPHTFKPGSSTGGSGMATHHTGSGGGGAAHGYGHAAHQRSGALRNSGHGSAHRIGKR